VSIEVLGCHAKNTLPFAGLIDILSKIGIAGGVSSKPGPHCEKTLFENRNKFTKKTTENKKQRIILFFSYNQFC
jgi:hypothetical protein